MNRVVKHVALPGIAPAAVVALYFTPVHVFGCVNRGWMAVSVVLVSTVAAIVTTAIGARRSRQKASAVWWLLSTLVLVLPFVLVFGPLA